MRTIYEAYEHSYQLQKLIEDGKLEPTIFSKYTSSTKIKELAEVEIAHSNWRQPTVLLF